MSGVCCTALSLSPAHPRESGGPGQLSLASRSALDSRFPPSRSALRRTRTRRSSRSER